MTASRLALVHHSGARDYTEFGVNDHETGRLLHATFSRLLGEMNGKRIFIRTICAMLAGLGQLDYRHADGSISPALQPDVSRFGWPCSVAVFERLGLTPDDLDQSWALAEARDGVHAVLELDIIRAFFPPTLWPIAEALVLWGPAETVERLERFGTLEARREVARTWARPERSTVAAGTLNNVLAAGRAVMAALCTLQERGYPAERLDVWVGVPRTKSAYALGAVDANTDRSAPPLLLVRRTLRTLNDRISSQRRRRGRHARIRRLLRERALLALVAITGARIGAIAQLRVRDYEPQHRFPDAQIGPAIRLFPGKTRPSTQAVWRALSDDVAVWLEEYLEHLQLTDSQAGLWPSDRAPHMPMKPPSLSGIFGGNGTRKALLPKESNVRGYSAHTLRHLAEQLAYEVGHDYLQEHDEAKAMVTPQVFADALLDRAMTSDHLGYKDLNTPTGRERWGRVAALGLWDYLWGDRGARKAPDRDRIIRARDRVRELEAETIATQLRIDKLREHRRRLERRGLDSTAPSSTDELVRLLLQLSSNAGDVDQEQEELQRLQGLQFRAEAELELARTTLVPLPDDVPLPELEEQLLVPAVIDAMEDLEPVRDWLSTAEAAHAFGVSEPTMRRWFRGELPHPAGDLRNPWQPEETDDVVECHSARKRRLVVSRLDRSRIAPEVMRAMKTLLSQSPS